MPNIIIAAIIITNSGFLDFLGWGVSGWRRMSPPTKPEDIGWVGMGCGVDDWETIGCEG